MIVCAVFMWCWTHFLVSEPSDDEDEVSEPSDNEDEVSESKNKIKMIF